MIVRTDSHIVLVIRHETERRLQNLVLTIENIKIEMMIGNAPAKDTISYVGIMFCRIETYAIVRTTCLLLPVNAEVIAPCILCRHHVDHSAAREPSECRILLQILRLMIRRNRKRFILAKRKLDARPHRITLAIVLHRCPIVIVKKRGGLVLSIEEVHVRPASEIARSITNVVVILAAALIEPRAFRHQFDARLMRHLRDDIDDAADGVRAVACRARAANDLDVVDVVDAETVCLVRRAVELAKTACKPPAIDQDQCVASLRAANRDRLAPHVVRTHLDALLGSQRVGERARPLAVEILSRDDGLRLRLLLEKFLLIVRLDIDGVRRHTF